MRPSFMIGMAERIEVVIDFSQSSTRNSPSATSKTAYLQAGARGFGMGSNLYTAGKTLEAIRQFAIELIAV